MKTDKLFYRIFLLEPNLVAELIPDLPPDCRFDYVAPVLKERERRLDGVLLPLGDDPSLPLVFLEAQMQGDPGFYRRFFAQVFLYLEQYQVVRPWRGLLLFPRRTLNFGEENPYQGVLATQVERFYLEDLIPLQELTPNLALLRLLVLSDEEAPENARRLLAQGGTEREFERRLDLVESIMVSKFPNLSLEAIREMLDITQVRVQDTQFYKDVFEKGQEQGLEQGLEQGESALVLRQLTRRCGELSEEQRQWVKGLSAPQRQALAEALLEFTGMEDFEAWLAGLA
ncbi:MAG: Rpn family recombination-promoting nuclease/putative transposase [Phormidium sp. PBR-2020]|nr:MAG: Rpn family recombination-promoting nuclease/putative transposase [Phormidium sp. PBR-2020]